MKICFASILLVLFVSCHKRSETTNSLNRIFWMEFDWVANDSAELTSLHVTSYLEFVDHKMARIAKRASYDGPIIYKEINLPDSLKAEILDLLRMPLDSVYLFDIKNEGLKYCGPTFYLNYSILGKDSNRVLFIPPNAPENLQKLEVKIQSLIDSPEGVNVKEFPIDSKFDEIIRDFGDSVKPPKIAPTKFIPPKI